MSTFKVPYTKILEILPHPNADRLEIAKIYGFSVIIQKNQYEAGDEIIYIPYDSIIPEWLENELFGPDSKIKLNKRRVRQIKIRKVVSQGMIINPLDISALVDQDIININFHCTVDEYGDIICFSHKQEDDLSQVLGITKYEPPQTDFSANIGKVKKRDKVLDNPFFHKYGGGEKIKKD